MNRFQPGIKFKSVEDFLEYLPDPEREIVDALRELIFSCLPDIEERLAYNVPFYYARKRLFFIWPSSIPWGGIKEGVYLGFVRGSELTDPHEILRVEKGKTMAGVTFHSKHDLSIEVIRPLIVEAAFLDNPKGTFGTFRQ